MALTDRFGSPLVADKKKVGTILECDDSETHSFGFVLDETNLIKGLFKLFFKLGIANARETNEFASMLPHLRRVKARRDYQNKTNL